MNITGLTTNNIELHQMDGYLLQQVGYEIARKINGTVIGYFPPSYPLNYFRLDIKIGENIMSILLHEYFPYIASASYEDELHIHFFDHEDVMTELKPYYTVLDAAFLNAPFTPNSHDLSESELKNEKHWRPNTNGEVIFNCWD
ncbi:hypothetical protein [Sporosarcina obsidiansis]|uniref:hypothetical protein n=1 Tax=Sporosarcina obsidiansis TaxID=2660748 RepID=UPI00129AAACC|nr:hypothetical protein [Sporosarcina obsidiansis]